MSFEGCIVLFLPLITARRSRPERVSRYFAPLRLGERHEDQNAGAVPGRASAPGMIDHSPNLGARFANRPSRQRRHAQSGKLAFVPDRLGDRNMGGEIRAHLALVCKRSLRTIGMVPRSISTMKQRHERLESGQMAPWRLRTFRRELSSGDRLHGWPCRIQHSAFQRRHSDENS